MFGNDNYMTYIFHDGRHQFAIGHSVPVESLEPLVPLDLLYAPLGRP